MKRHEIIQALRQYTHKADLDAMLTWGDRALEKYLNLMYGIEIHKDELKGVIIEKIGEPAKRSYKKGDLMLVEACSTDRFLGR